MDFYLEIQEIHEQMRGDYRDFMNAFATQRDAFERYQKRTDELFTKVEFKLRDLDVRVSDLESKTHKH